MLDPSRVMQILIVEDSASDRLITAQALGQARIASRIHFARDGVEAMVYLRGEDQEAMMRRPDLILLDLNLPKMDGRQVLSEIKSDPELRVIPVVVLTTSPAATDVQQAYARHANSYLIKPVDYSECARLLQRVLEYWFEVVTLPSRSFDQQRSRTLEKIDPETKHQQTPATWSEGSEAQRRCVAKGGATSPCVPIPAGQSDASRSG